MEWNNHREKNNKKCKTHLTREILHKEILTKAKIYRYEGNNVKKGIVVRGDMSKVYTYDKKELDALTMVVNKISKNAENTNVRRRKFINFLLGISESDLIELARRF